MFDRLLDKMLLASHAITIHGEASFGMSFDDIEKVIREWMKEEGIC